MTHKDFFTKALTLASNDKEMVEFIKNELAKIDKKNAKAKAQRIAQAASNEPLLNGIVDYLNNHKVALANELAQTLNISTSKASAMASKLVEQGVISKKEISIPKVGKRMAYSLVKVAKTETSASNDAEQAKNGKCRLRKGSASNHQGQTPYALDESV